MLEQYFSFLAGSVIFQRLVVLAGFLVVSAGLFLVFYLFKDEGMERSEAVTLLALLLFGFVFYIGQPFMTGAGGGEEYNYVLIGEEISESFRFAVSRIEGAELYLKPYIMYPVLVSVPSFFLLTTLGLGILVNTLSAVLMLSLIYLAVKRLGGRRAGLVAVLLNIFNPFLVHMARSPESMMGSGLAFFCSVIAVDGFSERGGRLWFLGLVISVLMMVYSRIGMWIIAFLALFMTSFYSESILETFRRMWKEIMALIVFLAIPFLMGVRYVLNMSRDFGAASAASNMGGWITFFSDRPFFVFLVLLVVPSVVYTLSIGRYRYLASAGVLHFFFYLTYRHASILDHSKFYFLFSTVFLCLLALSVSDILGLVEVYSGWFYRSVFLVFVILLCTGLAVNTVSWGSEDSGYLPAERVLSRSREFYPDCTVVPQDTRPVHLAGFENTLDPWYLSEDFGRREVVSEADSDCLLLYYEDEPSDRMERISGFFEAEKVYGYRYRGSYLAAYYVDISGY